MRNNPDLFGVALIDSEDEIDQTTTHVRTQLVHHTKVVVDESTAILRITRQIARMWIAIYQQQQLVME